MEQFNPELVNARVIEMLRRKRLDWESWCDATGVPSSTRCELHGETTYLDDEASIRTSTREMKMTAVYLQCPKCKADALVRERSESIRACGVEDDNILHASFENFICRTRADEDNLAAARKFAEYGRGFLLLLGNYGTGKSHLAVAIIRAMNVRARFLTQAGLLARLRATYRNAAAEDVVERCKRVRLLVLDELGVSTGGRDELPMLHDILTTRHGARKPTVLTTNLATNDELEQAIGPRMFDRLRQSGFAKLHFAGDSLRRNFRKQY